MFPAYVQANSQHTRLLNCDSAVAERQEEQGPKFLLRHHDGSGANAKVGGDDEEMQQFVPIEDLFKGRHFDRQIIVWCVSW
jgi:hypothetical protein